MEQSARARRAGVVAVAAAWAVGLLLRLWQLAGQVFDGDEAHAVKEALWSNAPRQILFVYHLADNCIPMTLFDWLLIRLGLRPDEIALRLPAIVGGALLLISAPLWAWRRLGVGPAVALAWLIAISPGLVFYSRIARPYAPAALLAGCAVACCESWLRRGGTWRGSGYVACVALATWFHLGALPLVLTPLLAAVWLGGRANIRRVAALCAASALVVGLVLLPAHETLVPLLLTKHGGLRLSVEEAGDVTALLAGTRFLLPAVLLWVLAAIGTIRLHREHPGVAAFVIVAVIGHLAATLAMAPWGHQHAQVLSRYLLLALPIALVPLAFIVGAAGGLPSQLAQRWLAGAALLSLIAVGPLVDAAWWRSSFKAGLFLRFVSPPPAGEPATLAVYRALVGRQPGTILEVPFSELGDSRVFDVYQRAHGQPLVVGTTGPLASPRLGLRTVVSAWRLGAMLETGASWVVVHRDLAREQRAMNLWWQPDEHAHWLRESARATVRDLTRDWGPPDVHAECCVAWNLARLREAHQRPPQRAERETSTASTRISPRVAIVAFPSSTLAEAGSPK